MYCDIVTVKSWPPGAKQTRPCEIWAPLLCGSSSHQKLQVTPLPLCNPSHPLIISSGLTQILPSSSIKFSRLLYYEYPHVCFFCTSLCIFTPSHFFHLFSHSPSSFHTNQPNPITQLHINTITFQLQFTIFGIFNTSYVSQSNL